MRIDEVKDHIGEEWVAGRGSYSARAYQGQRLRIDGIEVVEQKRYGYRASTQRVRYVRVTVLHEETGEPVPSSDGEPTTMLVEAKQLDQPWFDYWAQTQHQRDVANARRDAARRLNRYLPQRFWADTSWGGLSLTTEAVEYLVGALDATGAADPIAWTSEDGIHNLRRKRAEGHSHDTLQVRTDRRDDYNTVPLYLSRGHVTDVTASRRRAAIDSIHREEFADEVLRGEHDDRETSDDES
jgi:hypothetical protein